MTKRDRRALGRYVREVADLMELRDWHIDLSREPPDEDDSYATCEPIYGQRRAILRFTEGFRGRAPEDQRHTVVHELIHCHLAGLTNVVEYDVQSLIGKPAQTAFWNDALRHLEYGVDGLAHTIARHMPLPKWPEEKKS